MTNPIKRVYEADGSFQDVEMTSKEAAEFAAWQEVKLAEAIEKDAAIEAKANAKAALLNRLGITAEEAALLLA